MKNIIASFLTFFGSLFGIHSHLNQQATTTPVAQVQVSVNTSTSSKSSVSVTPSITVLFPNTNSISLGQIIPITWKTSGLSSSTVSIYLHDDTIQCKPGWTGCWTDFGIGGTNTNNYSWNTGVNMFGDGGPNSVSLQGLQNDKLRIKICDSTGQTCGYSPDFTVLSSTSASVSNNEITYDYPKYNFTFQFSPTFTATTTCDSGVVCAQYISDQQAIFSVNASSSESYEHCLSILYPSSGSIVTATTSQVTINGIVFEKDSTVEPAASTRYGIESYRTYYNGACYEIDLHAFWTAQNESYPTIIYPKLEAILSTFKFTAPQTIEPIYSTAVTTSTWVTYNGSLVPVTFEYPGVLSVNTKDFGSAVGDLWLTQSDEQAGDRTVSGSDLPGKIAVRDVTTNYSSLASAETDIQTHRYGYTSLTLDGEQAIRANTQSYDTSDSYYVAHNGKVYEIIIYDALPSEVQNFLSTFTFVS